MLEFLLINHPLDCPICDQAGECGLQDYYMQYGFIRAVFRKKKSTNTKWSILARMSSSTVNAAFSARAACALPRKSPRPMNWAFSTAAIRWKLPLFPGKRLDNPYAGNTVDICPVGALTSKDFRFKIRVWFLKETKSICPGVLAAATSTSTTTTAGSIALNRGKTTRSTKPGCATRGALATKRSSDDRVLHPHDTPGRIRSYKPAGKRPSSTPAAAMQAARRRRRRACWSRPQGTNEDLYALPR